MVEIIGIKYLPINEPDYRPYRVSFSPMLRQVSPHEFNIILIEKLPDFVSSSGVQNYNWTMSGLYVNATDELDAYKKATTALRVLKEAGIWSEE